MVFSIDFHNMLVWIVRVYEMCFSMLYGSVILHFARIALIYYPALVQKNYSAHLRRYNSGTKPVPIKHINRPFIVYLPNSFNLISTFRFFCMSKMFPLFMNLLLSILICTNSHKFLSLWVAQRFYYFFHAFLLFSTHMPNYLLLEPTIDAVAHPPTPEVI